MAKEKEAESSSFDCASVNNIPILLEAMGSILKLLLIFRSSKLILDLVFDGKLRRNQST